MKDHTGHPNDCGCRDCGPSRPLEEDRIVEALDPDCTPEGGFTVLRGFLGRGVAEGAWRLYVTLRLDEYYLLREEDIVAQQRDGHGSLVWVCPGTVLRRVRVGRAEDLAAEFLAGPIADRGAGLRPTGPSWLPSTGVDQTAGAHTWDCPQSYARTRCC